jgi:hypothetical protein
VALKSCKECGNDVSTEAASCPKCGAVIKKKSTFLRFVGGAFLVFITLIAVGSLISGISDPPKPATPQSKEQVVADSRAAIQQLETNPPDGFRSLKWGSSPNVSVKKYSGPTFDGVTMYVPASDKAPSPMFKVPVAEEAYSFSNGKFYSGSAWFDGRGNFEKVKSVLFATYGPPSFSNEQIQLWKWKWQGTKVEVHLSYQASFSRTTVTILNDAI